MTNYDVLIIGAGLSGIGMACHLKMTVPGITFAIIERRRRMGGTWDFFKYPGLRSDSDMFTFSYSFRPWRSPKMLAEGAVILSYIEETAKQYAVERHVQYGVRMTEASWSSADQQWTVRGVAEKTGENVSVTCRFLIGCTGYYDYDAGYLPEFPGRDRFLGDFLHPQHWPEGLDYMNRRIVVIGSGATAVTLVPALAEKAAHVTMLQRSPSYIFNFPAEDKISGFLAKFLPKDPVYALARFRNMLLQRCIYSASRRWPKQTRRLLLAGVRRQLGPDFDPTHFAPNYNPWDERLCAVPDADLFKAIRSERASIVTDTIDTLDENGIVLKSGAHLDADIIIAATGLNLQMLGGITLNVEGRMVNLNQIVMYKGVLADGLPNAGVIFGYTNAPWTMRSDLSSTYLVRLMSHMREQGFTTVTPRAPEGSQGVSNIMDTMQSGYVQRGNAVLPRQGLYAPWRVTNNYNADKSALLSEPIEDDALVFERAPATERTEALLV
ncbi:cation diffusion facilitator CzcD-associated flavoprotein CzcO [Sinorhizobium americanum]|uniref:Cation diffusion facilitator CzcD-associated flavoprotein CzcO n=2 Tax=Sinorhizobium americanum TaxID=194963 RepID=A0A4R2BED2_9HYPH|nr:cation diffusion facilitator CzcD-associated flavoprotein CzcO [Sinorhizobium americanum]